MNITRTMTLSALMVLIMIGITLLPAAMSAGPDPYTVTIEGGQSTTVTSLNTTFGTLARGTTDNEISSSFNLTNVGSTDAVISATFTTSVSTTYGLTNSTYVIGGANFSMNNTDDGTYVTLDNLLPATTLTGNNVAASSVPDTWDVKLDVPVGQYGALYAGTIEVTFADA